MRERQFLKGDVLRRLMHNIFDGSQVDQCIDWTFQENMNVERKFISSQYEH